MVATRYLDYKETIEHRCLTHNIKQLGFSGLRVLGSRINILVGGQVRTPKTQPFHIVDRYQQPYDDSANIKRK